MGLGPEPQALVRKLVAKLPKGFSVCELGNQMYSTVPSRTGGRMWEREPAEGFYREVGCGRYLTIDANGKASILADLNYPLELVPDGYELVTRYDLVTNWGTSEHCFNLAQVWSTIHDLTKPQGYIIGEQPTEGYANHGFVNLQPTFFTDLARDNDYRIEHLRQDKTDRGIITRFIYQRMNDKPFRYPTQGRYYKKLKV